MDPINILLVEDNPGDALLMRTALKKARVANQLVTAVNADEALDVLHQQGAFEDAPVIDIALFDINLPGMSGIELLHVVKNDEDLKHIPVIMLTSSDAPQDIQDSYKKHANCYLTKPVNVTELMELVQQLDSFWLSIVKLPNHA
jgi:CheY-like chemotaxis protein